MITSGLFMNPSPPATHAMKNNPEVTMLPLPLPRP